MKILQIIPSLYVGGAEKVCVTLSCELKELGHQVVVVSLYSEKTSLTEDLERQGIPVRFLNKKSGFDPFVFIKLRKVIKEEEPDVIHAHLSSIIYTLFSTRKRIVYTVHSMADKDAVGIIRKAIYRHLKSGRIIPVALSDIVRDSVGKVYNLDSHLISVVNNGVDLKKCIIKTDYSLKEKIVLLHVGRFSEPKNHLGMLAAFKIVHDEFPNTVLRLLGDGEKKQEILDYITCHDLEDSVELLGLQNNVYPFLSEADVFLLPSLYEGISIALAEAMGTGLPIVATKTGGTSDMITNGESGLLCSIDTQDIANCIRHYIVDYELRKKHGRTAIDVAKRFSSKNMAEKYLDVYRYV